MPGGRVEIVDGVVVVFLKPDAEFEFSFRVVNDAPVDDEWWDVDLRGMLARRENCPPPLQDGWWKRSLSQIDGITIHHTLIHDPAALARGYTSKGGGRPSIPYHVWVSRSGEVSYCLDLEEGCWHDHTGHANTHVSVGLAGVLDVRPPSDAQIDAAVRVVRSLLELLDLQSLQVHGHMDFFATRCPGWRAWRDAFLSRVD